ncbi:PEF-CTERM sorting domain-containing protein [Methanosarcina hadiensis]|uniref:DUF7507 domain-containing protein n=1 Tax=Methanosarcina hadiensis TaxID=3078083 RepID=UPI0039779E3D
MKTVNIIGLLVFLLFSIGSANACSIILEKSASPSSYDHVGQVITYTYKVTCKDGCVYGPILLKDDKTSPEPVTFNGYLKKGNSVVGTATYTVTQADLDRGYVTNKANATAKSSRNGSYNVKSNDAFITVKAVPKPSLSLEKSADPATYTATGQIITYAYKVTNSGNVAISGPIKVVDDKLGTVFISGSSLSPGQNVTGTATHTISQTDLDAGYITNIAYATGTYCKCVKSNTDTETVTLIKVPPATQVPEFPSIALPIASILGLVFIVNSRKKE